MERGKQDNKVRKGPMGGIYYPMHNSKSLSCDIQDNSSAGGTGLHARYLTRARMSIGMHLSEFEGKLDPPKWEQ